MRILMFLALTSIGAAWTANNARANDPLPLQMPYSLPAYAWGDYGKPVYAPSYYSVPTWGYYGSPAYSASYYAAPAYTWGYYSAPVYFPGTYSYPSVYYGPYGYAPPGFFGNSYANRYGNPWR